MAKEIKLTPHQKELSELADKRVKDLKGMTRRDRDKMSVINSDYQKARKELIEKHNKADGVASQKEADAVAKAKKEKAEKADSKAAKAKK